MEKKPFGLHGLYKNIPDSQRLKLVSDLFVSLSDGRGATKLSAEMDEHKTWLWVSPPPMDLSVYLFCNILCL